MPMRIFGGTCVVRRLALCPFIYCLLAALSATAQQMDPRPQTGSPQRGVSNVPSGIPSGIVESEDWRVTLPQQTRMIDGFTLDVFTTPANWIGYRPVRLTAKSATTFPSERTLQIVFTPLNHGGNERFELGIRSVIDCTLVLTQGDSIVAEDYYLPQYTFDTRYSIEVREAGQRLAGYQIIVGSTRRSPPLVLLPNQLGVLLPRESAQVWEEGDAAQTWEKMPDLQNLLRESANDRYQMQNNRSTGAISRDAFQLDGILEAVGSISHSFGDSSVAVRRRALEQAAPWFGVVLGEDELWDSWLGYESLDVLLLPLPMLERIALESPVRFGAIQDFTAAGGTLWLYGASSADAANRLFSLQPSTKQEQDAAFEKGRGNLSPAEIQAMRAHTWIREYVAGKIVLLEESYPFPGSSSRWRTLLHLDQDRSTAIVRRGVDSAMGDNRYWNWVLADVAKPPVFSFLALLGIFAFCVGPVAYYVSNRLARIYLMLLAAPVLALLTTLAMGFYGLVSDGLGYQGRVRQVTWVHSASGRGLEWSRATYFAGIQPADGLQFPAHAAVYPYPQGAEGRTRFSHQDSTVGQIRLTADQQVFQHGFLPGREQRQFITFAPQAGLGGIQFTVSADDSDSARTATATSRFPYPLRTFLMRDMQGDYWFAEKMTPSERSVLQSREESEVAAILRPAYTETMPELPEGFQFQRSSQGRVRDMDRISQALSGSHSSAQGLQDGVVEDYLREWMQSTGRLPKGTFFAVADVSDDMIARPQARLSDSIHFVMGTWE